MVAWSRIVRHACRWKFALNPGGVGQDLVRLGDRRSHPRFPLPRSHPASPSPASPMFPFDR
ncbi:hypothetical protein C4B68_37735 [Streptomyces dengpaensis]|uniref:Uncharacterized protein n=1 Tax=Streptomyces dengpaensis TaxID=2049881 RepID=A0ABN5IBP5_9ACTN|nr:hypothetical protein C4B68_37735 [Streptomyces dengpaensis]